MERSFRICFAITAALSIAACTPHAVHQTTPAPLPANILPRVSLFALGDTGVPPSWLRFRDGQLRVAEALAAEDVQRPADALLFLGDNFYPRGLIAGELEERVRENLVRPYCRFADLSGPDSRSVASACDTSARAQNRVPLLAVLGNHDLGSAKSPELQRNAVPRYLANWHLAGEPVERVELAPGVTLVFFDSTRIADSKSLGALSDALRAAQGEFRVLVAHHPLEDDESSRAIAAAIAAAGVPVQLLLAGHLHSLRVGTPGGAGPSLQIVAGGGASTGRSTHHVTGERFVLASRGFARVDLYEAAPTPFLRVTLYRVGAWPWLGSARGEPVAVWQVTRDGVASPYSGAGPGN